MAMPALMFELETPVEERVARLEANVEHIRSDISDVKLDLRRLNDKVEGIDQKLTAKIDGVEQRLSAKIDSVDEKLTAKIDSVNEKLTAKIDSVDEKIDAVDQRLSGKIDALKDSVASLALTMEKSFAGLKIGRALDRVWWLLMSAALLGVMARGFKWI
jgi:chromosome segregation ATPase